MRLERDNIPLDKEFPFQISEVELTPENSRPGSYHWHSYFEITCVLGGKGNYFVNGQEYTMEEDDIIINNVEPHGWKLIGGDMKLLVMIFSPEFVAEKLSIFDTEYLKPFVERGSNFKNRIGREEEVSGEIRSSIWEIYHEWQQKKEGYPLMIKANVLRILTMLIRAYQDKSKSGEMLREKKYSSTNTTPKPSPAPIVSTMEPRISMPSRAVLARGRTTSWMSSSVMPVSSLYGSSFRASSRAKIDSVPEMPTPASLKPTAPCSWVFQLGTVV